MSKTEKPNSTTRAAGAKNLQAARLTKKGGAITPPQPPQSVIPPGDTPPARTPEEQEAWRRYWADHHAYMKALFCLEDLQEIVARAGAPPLADTFHAQAIVRTVAGEINNRNLPPNPIIAHTQRKIASFKKAWGTVRARLRDLEDAQEAQKQWFEERPWYGPEGLKHRIEFIERLKKFSIAMDEIEPWLLTREAKSKGQHGGIGLKKVGTAVDIFNRLNWAWNEAGINKPVSKEKRYRIVEECLGAMGEAVSFDAVKKAISKYIKKYPHIAEPGAGNST